MTDGEEWKHNEKIVLGPEGKALGEYSSILHALNANVLVPIGMWKEKLNRAVVSFAKQDLEWKLADKNFDKLPVKITDAYQNLLDFVRTLEKASDKEIEKNNKILKGLQTLAAKCYCFGEYMSTKYNGINPCRAEQYAAVGAIAKADQNSELVKSAGKIVKTCQRCPYK